MTAQSITPPRLSRDNRELASSIRDQIEIAVSSDDKSLVFAPTTNKPPLGDAGVEYMAEYLSEYHEVKKLVLTSQEVTDAGAAHIASLVHHSSNLQWLQLGDNPMTEKGLEMVLEAAKNCVKLCVLKLDNFPSDAKAGHILADFLSAMPNLQSLELGGTELDNPGLHALGEAVAKHHSIRTLKIMSKQETLSDGALRHFTACIRKNHNLTSLCFHPSEEKADAMGETVYNLPNPNLYRTKTTESTKTNSEKMRKALDIRKLLPDNDQPVPAPILRAYESTRYVPQLSGLQVDGDTEYLAAMPPLPSQSGADTINALLAPQGKYGYAPIDHPKLYQQADTLFAMLEDPETQLRAADLKRCTPAGTSLLAAMAYCRPAEELIPMFNRRGIRIGAAELLEENGAANEAMQLLARFSNTGYIFNRANTIGMEGAEIRRLHHPFTDKGTSIFNASQKQEADEAFHRAIASCSSSPSIGRGR